MSDTIEQSPAGVAAGAEPSSQVTRSFRWTRSHTIALLIFLSLIPGFAAGVAREWWHDLPPGVRLPAYVVSGVLIAVTCVLILMPPEGPPSQENQPDQ